AVQRVGRLVTNDEVGIGIAGAVDRAAGPEGEVLDIPGKRGADAGLHSVDALAWPFEDRIAGIVDHVGVVAGGPRHLVGTRPPAPWCAARPGGCGGGAFVARLGCPRPVGGGAGAPAPKGGGGLGFAAGGEAAGGEGGPVPAVRRLDEFVMPIVDIVDVVPAEA